MSIDWEEKDKPKEKSTNDVSENLQIFNESMNSQVTHSLGNADNRNNKMPFLNHQFGRNFRCNVQG